MSKRDLRNTEITGEGMRFYAPPRRAFEWSPRTWLVAGSLGFLVAVAILSRVAM